MCVCFLPIHSLEVPAGVTQEEGHTGFLIIHLLSAVRALIFLARRIQPFLSLVDREVEFCGLIPVFMVTKSCTKILNFSTRFSCQHFVVEDFVTPSMGKKILSMGNVMFGHGFDKLV